MIGLKIPSNSFYLASYSSACASGFDSTHLILSSTAFSMFAFSSLENLSFNLSSFNVFLTE